MSHASNCHVISNPATIDTKQGLPYFFGVSAETAGAVGLCMHLGVVPPKGVAEPHLHAGHESAIYVLSGHARFRYGAELEHEASVGPGDFIYLGVGVPHQPFNVSDTEPVRFIVARTDPNEQESVVLLPELAAAGGGAAGS